MYSNNLAAFLVHLLDEENQFQIDNDDEITSGTLVTHRGNIVNSNVLAAMSQTITLEPTKTSVEPTKEG